jgi:hypothetical protein
MLEVYYLLDDKVKMEEWGKKVKWLKKERKQEA